MSLLEKLDQIVTLTQEIRAELQPPPVPEPVPPPDPPRWKLLSQSDLIYQGSARLPWLEDLQYPDGAMAVREPGRLTVQGRRLAFDVEIPSTIIDARISSAFGLPNAFAQPLGTLDPLDARLLQNPADTTIRGIFYDRHGNAPFMSVASYYDASNAQTCSHLRYVADSVTTYTLNPIGHTCGFMSWAPPQFGNNLMLTGNFGLPIVTRQSFGPCAFLFDPQNMGAGCMPLLDYPGGYPLGPWNEGNPVWHSDSKLGGLHWIKDTRSLLFVGVHGLGPWCYGPPWSGECVNVKRETDDHGSHSDPYVYRIWAYDTDDLDKVHRGELQPWEPRPYGLWNLELPYKSTRTRLTSAYDPATQQLYLLQQFGAFDDAQGFPVLHVYQVQA